MADTSRRAFLALGLGAAAAIGASAPERLPDPRPYLRWLDGLSLPATSARPADAVVDAYAVNTKLFYASQVYGYTEAVVDLLTELGVRTVRERVTTGNSRGALAQRAAMPQLAERGIRWHATVAELDDWFRAEAATRAALSVLTGHHARAVGGDLTALLHSLGGCNEIDGPVVDGQVDPQWPEHARLMQTALWQQAKANPLTADIPVTGPSTRTDVTPERAEMLGDLSAVSDWGNAHLYNRGGSPTRFVDRQREILAPVFPGVPRWFFTETGYNNAPEDDTGRTVRESAAATYAVRAICDYFVRDCIWGRFELLDDPDRIDFTSQETINRTANRQAHFGLVAMTEATVATATPDTWRKKPEFVATQRLLRLLADPGPTFRPDPLPLWVTGGTPDLQQTLVQKRDGRHYLLLWRDVDVATTFPDARAIPVPPSRVTLHLSTARPVAVYSPRRQAVPVDVQPPGQAVRVDVGGDLMIVEIG